jgi:hypothetical protein
MNNDAEKLQQAKELVSQKRYDEARVILETMPDNPTAQKWLGQLDKAPGTPTPPPTAQAAAPAGRSSRPPIQMDEVQQQAQAVITKLNISLNLAVLVLIIAAVAAVLSALLDVIIGLPTGALWFRFGWFVPALVGLVYPLLRGKADRGGLAVSVAAGLVFMIVWYILAEILGDTFMNFPKALLVGIILSLCGYGWYVLLPFLRDKVQPLLPNLEK